MVGIRKISLWCVLSVVMVSMSAYGQERSESGSGSVVAGKDMEGYPSLDLLNSFTGVVPGVWQTENYGRTGVRYNALNASLAIRGFYTPIFIVDGVVVRDETELQITPEEIEYVHVLSDVLDKMKYGPEAAHGAIYVRTLRGTRDGRTMRFGFEKGVDVVDRFPGWIDNGLEYAGLNNTARTNAGYPIAYSDFALRRLADNNPYDVAFPSVDYKSQIFKSIRDYQKVFGSIRGGSKGVTYSATLSWSGQGDIFKVGSVSDYNRLNSRMNMDIRLNDRLSVDFNFIGIYGIRRSPLGRYGSTDNTSEFASVWKRAYSTPPAEYPLSLGVEETTGEMIYPVSTAYPDHPLGSISKSGSYKETTRTGITNLTLYFDMSFLLKGLRSESQVGYNLLYMVRTGQASDYVGYNVDSDTWSSTSTSHRGQSDSEESYYKTFYLQGLQFRQRFRMDRQFGQHSVNSNLTYYRSREVGGLYGGYHNQQYFSLEGRYSYDSRYCLEFLLNYAGSTALEKGHRYGLFPAVGLSWNILGEKWMKRLTFVDALKLRLQAGSTGHEVYGDQFYWQSRYTKSAEMTFGAYNIGQWFGPNIYTTRAANIERLANHDLTWEKLHEFVIGMDARLWGGLDFSLSSYHTVRDGVVTDISSILPMASGGIKKYGNYNAYLYRGLELKLSYGGKIRDLGYNMSASALFPRSKVLKYCENVAEDNLKHVGKSTSAIFGYDCIGIFSSAADIENSPAQYFDSEVYPGDLKYRDVTGNGIVDTNDSIVIGDSAPRMMYSLFLNLSWKRFYFSIVGTGKAWVDVMRNNEYYWNGWGDGNYSKFVRDNLETGRYPRLSYIKSQNNFRNSRFWMSEGSFFKIQYMELGYDFPKVRIFLKGANLLTISGIKDCDPESMSSGVSDYPLFRTFTGGMKLTF